MLDSQTQQKTTVTLQSLLSIQNITVHEMFQQPNILDLVNSDMRTFTDFCQINEEFTKKMIKYGIQTPMDLIDSEQMETVVRISNNILIEDKNEITELFIIDDDFPQLRLNSCGDEEDIEQIINNELMNKPIAAADQSTGEFDKKYKYLLEMLSYVEETNLDEICINSMAKVLNNLVKAKADQMCQFFMSKEDLLRKIVELTNFPSISSTILRLINETDNEKFINFKVNIVNLVIKQLLRNIQNINFSTYLQFVEEAFIKNRHRGEIDDIKIATQSFVNKDIINKMLGIALSNQSEITVSNSLLYLLRVVERMNVDEETVTYICDDFFESADKQTMNFEAECIFEQFNQLVSMASLIIREKYSSAQILVYYELIFAICQNSRFDNIKINKAEVIIKLLKSIISNEANFNGIIKNKIVMIIDCMLQKQPKTNIDELLTQIRKSICEQSVKLQSNNSVNLCFIEKLKIMLQLNTDQKVQEKYSSQLHPNDYIRNLNKKIKEFKFVHLCNGALYHLIKSLKDKKQQKIEQQINEKQTQKKQQQQLQQHQQQQQKQHHQQQPQQLHSHKHQQKTDKTQQQQSQSLSENNNISHNKDESIQNNHKSQQYNDHSIHITEKHKYRDKEFIQYFVRHFELF